MPRIPPLVLAAAILLLTASTLAQAPPGPLQSQPASVDSGPDSPAALEQLLKQILDVAKNTHSEAEVEAQIRNLEVPDYQTWGIATFGQEKGEAWAEKYSQFLAEAEKNLANSFLRWSGQQGSFYVRKVGDSPPRITGRRYLDDVKQPVEAFSADWRVPTSSQGSYGLPVGYFLFIQGQFRWDETVQSWRVIGGQGHEFRPGASQARIPVSSSNGRPSYPTCQYCPPPPFPKGASKSDTNVTVRLSVTVQTDGHATDIKVDKGGGANYDQAAIDAVSQWIFHPAADSDGNPIPQTTFIEVQFHRF